MELFLNEGRVSVITGGGSGIGKLMATTLAESGAKVVLIGRSLEKLNGAASDIFEQTGSNVSTYACDVTDKEQVNNTVKQIIEDHARIDILVNNAGTSVKGTIGDLDEEGWDKVMETNTKSVFLFSQAVAPFMKKEQYGRIINTASVAGDVSLFFSSVYGTSKAGVIHLTKQLAGELAPYQVTVNSISPWFFKTELNEESLENEQFRQMVENRTPIKRIGQLDELKTTVLYFASQHSSYVNGQNIFVDGGMTSFGL